MSQARKSWTFDQSYVDLEDPYDAPCFSWPPCEHEFYLSQLVVKKMPRKEAMSGA